MNALLVSFFLGLSATLLAHGSTLCLEPQNYDQQDWEDLVAHLNLNSLDLIYFFNVDEDLSYLSHFKKTHPYLYQAPSNMVILSQKTIDYCQVHDFGANHWVIETAFNDHSSCIYHGHLPHFSQDNLLTLSSFYQATNPYLKVQLSGDLVLPPYSTLSPWQLCVKGDGGVSFEIDNKGKKSAEADVTFRDDNDRYSAKGSAQYEENDKGEKSASGKIELRGKF